MNNKAETSQDPSRERKTPQTQALLRKLTSFGLPLVAALIAMFGALVAGFLGYSGTKQQREAALSELRQREMAERNAAFAEQSRLQVQELQRQVEMLQRALQNASRPTNGGGQRAELSPVDRHFLDELKVGQDQLSTRMGTLENVLANTPEKALALPMLRQQVDSLQDRTHSDLEGVRGEIGRLFTLTQWFIALMFTIALGVFGLALSNIRRGDRTASEK